jgi:hypothetical protein
MRSFKKEKIDEGYVSPDKLNSIDENDVNFTLKEGGSLSQSLYDTESFDKLRETIASQGSNKKIVASSVQDDVYELKNGIRIIIPHSVNISESTFKEVVEKLV